MPIPKQTQFDLAEATWEEMYPDRRPFAQIGEDAQKEWIKVFRIYTKLYSRWVIAGVVPRQVKCAKARTTKPKRSL